MRPAILIAQTLAFLVLFGTCSLAQSPRPEKEVPSAIPGKLAPGECVRCVDIYENIITDPSFGRSTHLEKVVSGPVVSVSNGEVTITVANVEMKRQVEVAGTWKPDDSAYKGPGVMAGERYVFRPLEKRSESAFSRTFRRCFVERCEKH